MAWTAMTDRSVSIHFGKMSGMDLSGKGMELELTANGIVLRTDLNCKFYGMLICTNI